MPDMPVDLSFVVQYNWDTIAHLKEALRIALLALMDGGDSSHDRPQFFELPLFREVAFRMACGPDTIAPVLCYLVRSGDVCLIRRIAENPSCSSELLAELAKHEDADVRGAVAENMNCSINVLYKLSTDEHPDVRYRMAEDVNLPNSILELLGKDDNPYVASRAQKTLRRISGGMVVEGKFKRQDHTTSQSTAQSG